MLPFANECECGHDTRVRVKTQRIGAQTSYSPLHRVRDSFCAKQPQSPPPAAGNIAHATHSTTMVHTPPPTPPNGHAPPDGVAPAGLSGDRRTASRGVPHGPLLTFSVPCGTIVPTGRSRPGSSRRVEGTARRSPATGRCSVAPDAVPTPAGEHASLRDEHHGEPPSPRCMAGSRTDAASLPERSRFLCPVADHPLPPARSALERCRGEACLARRRSQPRIHQLLYL
jgi:hypothetical protein